MKKLAVLVLILALVAPATAASKLKVAFADPKWTGKLIPAGMHCSRFGGSNPTSPPLRISDIPQGTVRLIVEFDDESYQPLSYDGGHGKFALEVGGKSEVVFPPIPEGVSKGLPEGVTLLASHRGWSDEPAGYLPPCSGGRGNRYSVTIRAVSAAKKELGKGYLILGSY